MISVITFIGVTYAAHSEKPEFIESLFELLGAIAWPVVTLIIFVTFFLTFQEQIGDLVERIREFQAGSTAFKVDPIKTEQDIEKAKEISKKTSSEEEAAKQLLNEQVLEVAELRILRGLVGESGGRGFYSFRRNDYYRPAFDSLAAKNLIFKAGKKYFLTPLGTKVVKVHLTKVLEL